MVERLFFSLTAVRVHGGSAYDYDTDRLHQSLGWRTPKELCLKDHCGMVEPAPPHM